jgi:hypothetical protein
VDAEVRVIVEELDEALADRAYLSVWHDLESLILDLRVFAGRKLHDLVQGPA